MKRIYLATLDPVDIMFAADETETNPIPLAWDFLEKDLEGFGISDRNLHIKEILNIEDVPKHWRDIPLWGMEGEVSVKNLIEQKTLYLQLKKKYDTYSDQEYQTYLKLKNDFEK